MKVAEVFRRPIERRIEEVIKVELDDEKTVADELTEYVATERIQAAMGEVLDSYQETIDSPTEDTNVWISGFFGSGKSSFAKVIGYLVANPVVDGKPASDWFFAHTTAPRLKQLLTTKIHDRAKTVTVLVDLLSARNVLNEGESIVLPLYRALLDRLGYSTVIALAEQEIRLEKKGHYEKFAARYQELYDRPWSSDHHDPLAKSEMSRVLHDIEPETFETPDSFAHSNFDIAIDANWLAQRALELPVAGFLNAHGGTLVIGVADDGAARGLHDDYVAVGNKGRDGYENFLTTLLDSRIGRAAVAHVAITFDVVDGHDVCRVDVKPSPEPVFVSNDKGDADFYVRLNNSTRLLNTADALKYVRQHWR